MRPMSTKSPRLRESEFRRMLEERGIRVTEQRLAILSALARVQVPISHPELTERMANSALDRATIYRNLLSLTEAGVLVRTQLGDNVWRYELPRAKDAEHRLHPHFVCTDCGEVTCLPENAVKLNCQNPDNTGTPIEGEENQRGIQLLPHTTTVAQITIHTDHLFWPTIAHENLPLFNQFASNAVPQADATYRVSLDDLASVPVPTLTDRSHLPISWRSCVASSLYVLPTRPSSMTFDIGSQAIANLRAFVEFNARTMGHLNADGLCYVK